MSYCDCERGHNGIGLAGRECDCPPGLMADITQLRAEVARLRWALGLIAAPIACGCVPCTGSCRSDGAKAIYFDDAQDVADEALADRAVDGENKG